MLLSLVMMVLFGSIVVINSEIVNGNNCRDRNGLTLPYPEFKISTCSMCYYYLIKENPKFYPVKSCGSENQQTTCLMEISSRRCHCPSTDNKTSMDYISKMVHSPQDVKHWLWCCEDAEKCCQQQSMDDDSTENDDGNTANIADTTNNDNVMCPHTWDGWMCWNDSIKGMTVSKLCPRFLNYDDILHKNYASKTCTENGSWWVDAESNKEKTDYSTCLSQDTLRRLKFHEKTTIVRLAFNAFGMILLVPAIIIFFIYRNLRHQNRIKLHINLFISLLISGLLVMCWDVIKYQKIVNESSLDILENSKDLCKTLNMLEHYCRSTTYFWMLCEGFYLHRLLVKAFIPPKHLIAYYIFGWGSPLVIVIIYAAIRSTQDDDSGCWINAASGRYHGLEWLLFAPTIFCIVLNLFFLMNIVRILLRQLAHPKEPTNYRKAVRATFVLIPLLGIHQFFTIYTPLPGEKGYYFFIITGAIIYNSQAIIISFIFCYFNGEVLFNIKTSWYRLHKPITTERKSVTSLLTSRRPSAISIGSNITRVPSGQSLNGDAIIQIHENGINCRNNTGESDNNGITNMGFIEEKITHL